MSLSITGKEWRVAPVGEVAVSLPDIHPIALRLLAQRGLITPEAIHAFLHPDYTTDTHDPFLFIDMTVAVERILSGIAAKQKIVVYGDYDADGVSSTAVMVTILRGLGAIVDFYIPFRETEGYGLNMVAVTELIQRGTNLVITVDCGISNLAEVAALQAAGVDVIVTDHHQEPPELPPALAIINHNTKREQYPYKYLAGCGVAFKLAQGLLRRHGDFAVTQLPAGWDKWLLDIVAIGTVADMMPLVGENRTLVTYGLVVLKKTKRLGLQALAHVTGGEPTKFDERSIGFQIAPRLNAAGRLNHASTAYKLLVTNDAAEAAALAGEIDATNQERQKITEQIAREARQMIGDPASRKLLAASGVGWPTGVVGLVAGRLADEWHRPSLVISHFNGTIVGSGRSIAAFDITAALRQCSQYLARYGGHAQACGFTVKDEANLPLFIDAMTKLAEQQLQESDLVRSITIDAAIALVDADWELVASLAEFAPFGEGNPKPRFKLAQLTIIDTQPVGAEGKHVKLMVQQGGLVRKLIGFNLGAHIGILERGAVIDAIVEIDSTEWNGNRELQLRLIDALVV